MRADQQRALILLSVFVGSTIFTGSIMYATISALAEDAEYNNEVVLMGHEQCWCICPDSDFE